MLDALKALVSIKSTDGSGQLSTTWSGIIALVVSYIVAFAAKHGVTIASESLTATIYQALLLVGMIATTFGGIKRIGNIVLSRPQA